MSLALARKYRPRSFAELVGQEHVVRALSNALDQSRLHHAYLFTGTRGVGKTTLARILAKAFNCEQGVSAKPCGACGACTEIDGGRFVDLLELDAASNTQVDQMRELLENALYAPTRGRFKVYIIDEVHMLSRNAFNAMLKTLEEPPAHVKFILATTDPQKVPVTVLSRCLQFGLKQIPQGEIRRQMTHVLERESVQAEPAALALLARAAQGSLRDGLSLLDQAIVHGGGAVQEESVRQMLGSVDRGRLIALLDALAASDGRRMVELADELLAGGASFDSVLEELATVMHRLALYKSIPEALPDDEPEADALRELAGRFSPEELQLCYQIALHGRNDLGLAPDHHSGFTMTLLRMLTFKPDGGRTVATGAAPASSRSQIPPQNRNQMQPRSSSQGPAASRAIAAAADGAPSSRMMPVSADEAPVSRMKPASTGEVPPRRPIPEPTDEAATLRTVPLSTDDAAAESVAVQVQRPGAPVTIGDWAEFIGTLKLGGMAAMLAQHCALVEQSGTALTLRLPEAHRHLLDKSYRDKLQGALESRLGHKLALQILVGDTAGRTPQEIEAAEQRKKLDKAIAAIEGDPFVRELVENFDARIVSDSIKPLQ